MQSQITCPNCQTPFMADIHQIVDVGQTPEMKQLLLSGYLNTAQCPVCQAVTQVTTPILYHDPAHELFLIHIPLELSMKHEDQEKLIGQLIQQAMDRLPPEERKGYMLQPQTVMSMQTLLERVLETEGITKEMIDRQKEQVELLQNLTALSGQDQSDLILQNEELIDGTFFAILRSMMEAADSSQNEDESIKLINLQAKLYKYSSFGKKLERQQQAVQQFSREVRKEGQLSSKLLLKHVLANREDMEIVEALVIAGQPAFNYEFFVLLSDKIEKRQNSGVDAEALIILRTSLLEIQDELERRSRELMSGVQETLQNILESEDKRAAVRANLGNIDTVFLNVLSSLFAQAKQRGDTKTADELSEIQGIIIDEIENQAPPNIRLINQLLRTESEEELLELLDGSQELLDHDLLKLVESIKEDARRSGEVGLANKAEKVESVMRARILVQD